MSSPITAEAALHFGDVGMDVDGLGYENLFAAKSEELAGERGSAIGGFC